MESHDPITVGQIGKIQELLGAALRKSGLQNNPVQQVIERQGTQVIGDMIAVLRKYVEAISDMIIRHVTVDGTRSPQDAIRATERIQFVNYDVVVTMPRGGSGKNTVFFVKRDEPTSDDEWDVYLDSLGLEPCDPFILAAFNEADPTFADEHPNGTHWKDADGRRCYIAFDRWDSGRVVSVYGCGADSWNGRWWFAGRLK